jgi:hypothetical protein
MTRCYSEWRKQDPLNGSLDWETLQAKYLRERLVIIDDLFSPDALEELLRYTRAEANFR